MLLRADSNHEAGDGYKLFANSDVSLSNEDSSVMNGASNLPLGNEGLKSSLHELGKGKSQDVIEFSFSLFKETKSYHSSDKCITYK